MYESFVWHYELWLNEVLSIYMPFYIFLKISIEHYLFYSSLQNEMDIKAVDDKKCNGIENAILFLKIYLFIYLFYSQIM